MSIDDPPDTAGQRLRALADRIDRLSSADPSPTRLYMRNVDLFILALMREIDALESESAAVLNPRATRLQTMTRLAAAYGADADRAQVVTTRLYIAMVIVFLAAVGSVIAGILGVSAVSDRWSTILVGHMILAGLFVLAVVPLAIQAERHRRSGAESRRLQRQFAALDAYLEPMPKRIRAMMRAALAPRLFSRLLEDDDPVREPLWPTSDSLYPSHSDDRNVL
jgi:hypothetical protein